MARKGESEKMGSKGKNLPRYQDLCLVLEELVSSEALRSQPEA